LHTDHVSELDVVTGTGERVRCSKTERADLFDAMLVGQGQCGLIVGATLRLIRAPSSVRTFTLAYPDLAACTADAVRLVREDRFDALGVNIANAAGGGFAYSLAAGVYVRPGAQPDEAKLLAGLNHTASSANEAAYPALVRRLDGAIGMLRAAPGWTAPHPWLALMLPASKIGAFVAPLLANPAERAGVIPFQPLGLLPLATARLTNPLLCAPAEDVAFSVVLLRTAQPATADGMLALNRTLYERARDLGGKRVIWGAIPFSAADWADHYGEQVGARFREAKRRYDPRNVLTPGPGIF
jgi:FAD/FMN-containing dehydrogenase